MLFVVVKISSKRRIGSIGAWKMVYYSNDFLCLLHLLPLSSCGFFSWKSEAELMRRKEATVLKTTSFSDLRFVNTSTFTNFYYLFCQSPYQLFSSQIRSTTTNRKMEDKSKQKKEVEVLVVSGIKGLVERLRVHSDRLLIPKGIELKVINYEGTIAKDIEASGNESDKDIIPYLRNATIMLADPGLLV